MMIWKRNIQSDTDEELLRAYIHSGEMEYFGILYNRYMPMVYGVCLKYLAIPENAEDAVMQLFEEVSGKVMQHRIENFKNWLYRVAQNHCLQILRQKSAEIPTEWLSQPADTAEFLDLLSENGDDMQLQALHHCMERLPEEQRYCVQQFFIADKSYAEIAEQKGYERKGVKSYIQNGKRNLKLCIEKTTKEWDCCPI